MELEKTYKPKQTEDKIYQMWEKEGRSGLKVISYCFEIPGWEPYEIIKKDRQLPVYFYEIPRPRPLLKGKEHCKSV